MTEILIARHGETEWNRVERFRGRVSVPLNDTGFKQAEALARHLSAVPLEAVYCSPIERARQTADIIAQPHHMQTVLAEGLTDLDFGEWQGKTLPEVEGTPAFRDWVEHPEQVRIPGGESLEEARQRAMLVVDAVVRKHSGRVVLVTHRVIVKVLVCALLGLDNSHFWAIRTDTAAISGFTFEKGRYILDKHNDSCYVSDMGRGLKDF